MRDRARALPHSAQRRRREVQLRTPAVSTRTLRVLAAGLAGPSYAVSVEALQKCYSRPVRWSVGRANPISGGLSLNCAAHTANVANAQSS